MSEWFAIPMLFAGGLFAGAVTSIALERVPASAGDRTLRIPKGIRVHPATGRPSPTGAARVSLVSTIGFALGAEGTARASAMLATACFLIVLVGSVAWLVPVQRRLVSSGTEQPARQLERLRSQWLRGHWIRTVVALSGLSLAIAAAVS